MLVVNPRHVLSYASKALAARPGTGLWERQEIGHKVIILQQKLSPR